MEKTCKLVLPSQLLKLWRMRSRSLNPKYKSFLHLPELLNSVAGTALFLFSENIIKRMSPSAAQIQGHFNFFLQEDLGAHNPNYFYGNAVILPTTLVPAAFTVHLQIFA